MASSSLGSSIPAPEAVQLLVSSLADDSSVVREASMASLRDIASLNPLLVLDCCYAVSRGGRRRFGNMAGVFQVMAFSIGALEKGESDAVFMGKLAKIATTEIISSKELNADWQRQASGLLVSIGTHFPDLMMEEIFLHLSGPSTASPAMVQILADFASYDALQFTPRLKDVLSRVLPILGTVRDLHRPIFANAFKCWSQAVWLYTTDLTSASPLDSDVMSFLNSVFELLLRVWTISRDHKVRVSTVEALGQMVGLITRTQLKSALPRLIPAILELYKKDHEDSLLATCSLQNLLNASLLSESGPPLLDFEDLTIVLSTLLPVIGINSESKRCSGISVGRKTYNEVQRCFLTVGLVYPEDLFTFLLNKCKLKEDPLTFGALCILKHLLPRLLEAWHPKQPLLVEAARSLLDEESLAVRKALSELIVVMASHCYMAGPSGELFVEYLVRHSAIGESDNLKAKGEPASPTQLRAVCGKGLLLLTVTIPEMEYILWPFLLKMIIPRVYTGAVASVCRCISELCRRRSSTTPMLIECKARADIPSPEELFTRLVVLLHNPLAKEQLATQILTVLGYLSPLFPKNISMFWQDEIPKMKAYVFDTEDLKLDPTYQETWDDMIINFLAESLDVTQDADWVISLGNAFAKQYILYTPEDDHTALLHRCIGILLQKVNDRAYVRDKIDWMYQQADISIPANRLGLAKAMGLVAASHLDTVLEKLKIIVDNVGQNIFQRILSLFSESYKTEDSDNIHAALAMMYGYAAKYAPSSVIEARIDALVGTNMLSRLLHVRQQTAKQAVITAIDLLGRAVINASDNGVTFPLKRRDQMLDYILTLMGRDENEGFAESSLEVLHTQALALNACTTLVSVEPKLTVETRNRVMKATLGFFALPNDPSDVINPLIDNLVTLLCAILLTSGEDGRSRAEQLLHLLRQLDQFVSSPIDYQRKRGCVAVHEMLLKFRKLCVGGYCALGCSGDCPHRKYADRSMQGNFSNLPSVFLFPDREVLCLGDRVITYLPRCADTNSEVRKFSAQILDQFFSISLSLPKAVLTSGLDSEDSYKALSSLEDVIAILKSDASIDPSEVFNRIVSSICSLLTETELVAALHSCTAAICDKIRQSAEGAIQAVTEFVSRRGSQLSDNDISRTTQSLLSAAVHITDKILRVEAIGAISTLAENTQSSIVFNEVLATAGRDIMTKDITRMRGGWPMQDAFYAFSQHTELSVLFMEHLISVLNRSSLVKVDSHKGETTSSSSETHVEDDILQAAIFALTAFFRGGGKIGKKAVEKSYSSVVGALTLQLGSCHGLASSGQQDPLRVLLTSFHAFCECVGDLEMGKILSRNGEQREKEKWVDLIGDIAGCISIKRPKEVRHICMILTKALNRPQRYQREAAAAALSEFIRYCGDFSSVMEEMVEALCRHVSDDSPTVRRLCLRGLVQSRFTVACTVPMCGASPMNWPRTILCHSGAESSKRPSGIGAETTPSLMWRFNSYGAKVEEDLRAAASQGSLRTDGGGWGVLGVSEAGGGSDERMSSMEKKRRTRIRGGGKIGKKAVEKSYSSVVGALTLQLGSCHGLASSGQQDPLRVLLTSFHAFCECVGDLEMGKILSRNGEQREKEKWVDLIGDIAGCISIKRPKEVRHICMILTKALNRPQRYQREAAAAALSEFIRYCGDFSSVMEEMVEALCRHVSDDSPTVRRLCLRGLVQMPSACMDHYTTQVIGVILALLDDLDESVQLTAVSCLLMVTESASNDAVEPILLNLSVRLRNLQVSMDPKMRANAFEAFGTLSKYAIGGQREGFVEQIHSTLPRLVVHLHDDDPSIRQACRETLKRFAPLMDIYNYCTLYNSRAFGSDDRSDYENFLRDLSKHLVQESERIDTYMASTIQAFDAPWPVIQANAIHFATTMLSLSDDQHIISHYYPQVFETLVNKMTRSLDSVVRAACSSAFGLLLRSSKSTLWRGARLDRTDSGRKPNDPESVKK